MISIYTLHRRIALAMAIWATAIAVAHAGPADRAEKAWRDWVNKFGATQSQFAIAYEGKILRVRSIGIAKDKPMDLASLSKAVTGICAGKLDADNILKLDLPIGKQAFSIQLAEAGKIADVTPNQLLTHTSGLDEDISQGIMHIWQADDGNRLTKTANEVLKAIKQPLKGGPHFYNNGNYALLGAIIESATGHSYENVCGDVLAEFHGGDGFSLSRSWHALSAFGGWQASAENYLKFANHAYGKGAAIQKPQMPNTHAKMTDKIWYGAGFAFRKGHTGGRNVWHFGLLCTFHPTPNVGSYFTVWGSKWSVAVTHNVCPPDGGAFTIDGALAKAVFARN